MLITRRLFIFILFVTLIAGCKTSEQKSRTEAEDYRQTVIEHFNQYSSQILTEARTAFESGNYDHVIYLSSKNLPAQNQELIDLGAKAKSELVTAEQAKREAQTQEILAQLKKGIPASDYKTNRDLYQQLVTNNPENDAYKKNLKYYSARAKEQEDKERIAQEAQRKDREAKLRRDKFGDPPVQSGWDGSYNCIKKYLKMKANDPDSIKLVLCTKVYYTDSGWLVGCKYRGRNAFGGIVLNYNWFTIVNNAVIQMHDWSAYDP